MKTYHYFCIMGVIEYIAARKYDAWMQKKAEEKASLYTREPLAENPHISIYSKFYIGIN